MTENEIPRGGNRVMWFSTLAFTLMFAVWLQFGILAIPIRKEFGLTDMQFGWLAAIAILNGSLWRLLFGIWADRFGARKVLLLLMGATAGAAWLVSMARSFTELMVAAFLVGMAGNSFSIGIAWNSAWFPKGKQGFALGLFGAGNVGASVTKFIGPFLIAAVPSAGYFGGAIQGGWRFVPQLYAGLLVLMMLLILIATPSQDRKPGQGRTFRQLLEPMKIVRVWRFSLYYVVVFGAYVALSVWLPKYYVDVYEVKLGTAALLTATFIFPASLLRPVGGWLSDRLGARGLMYGVFMVLAVCFFLLSLPFGHIVFYVPKAYVATGMMEALPFSMGIVPFSILVFLVGCAMGIGKAAVFKYVPEYFPKDVGAVGGMVGSLGGLGGFFLPLLFAWLGIATKIPQTTFAVLFVVNAASLFWLQLTVWRILHVDVSPATARHF